jgi:hypothetical protein
MGFFETIDITRVVMATYVKILLAFKNLLDYKLTAYVKDEGGNLSTFA